MSRPLRAAALFRMAKKTNSGYSQVGAGKTHKATVVNVEDWLSCLMMDDG